MPSSFYRPLLNSHPKNIVTNFAQRKGWTHFLCFPVVTPLSKPHFRALITSLLEDAAGTSIPKQWVRPLGTLHVGLGGLRLGEPEQLKSAKEVLQNFNIGNVLDAAESCRKEGIQFDAKRYWSGRERKIACQDGHAVSSPGRIRPLDIMVSGLSSGDASKETHTKSLDIWITDLSGRLAPLSETLKHAFNSAGFFNLGLAPHSETNRVRAVNAVSSVSPVRIVSAANTGPLIASRKSPGLLTRLPLDNFNAKDLIQRHKDDIWLENAHLDRISVCQLGLYKATRNGRGGLDSDLELTEEFSVSLP